MSVMSFVTYVQPQLFLKILHLWWYWYDWWIIFENVKNINI